MTKPSTSYLICYDISESRPGANRRLVRVRRRLLGVATPLQYSVFCGTFTAAGRRAILSELAEVIDPRCDDVRLYPISTDPWLARIGRAILPEGLIGPERGMFPGNADR